MILTRAVCGQTVAELDGMYRALVEERTAVAEERDKLTALQAEAKQVRLASSAGRVEEAQCNSGHVH